MDNLMKVTWSNKSNVTMVVEYEAWNKYFNLFSKFNGIDDAMGKGDERRMALEADFMMQAFKGIIALEGEEGLLGIEWGQRN